MQGWGLHPPTLSAAMKWNWGAHLAAVYCSGHRTLISPSRVGLSPPSHPTSPHGGSPGALVATGGAVTCGSEMQHPRLRKSWVWGGMQGTDGHSTLATGMCPMDGETTG